MEQRISIITLGVADLARARAFYDALGWQRANDGQEEEIIAYDLLSMTLCLYPLAKLCEDIGIAPPADGVGLGGVTLAYNVPDAAAVARVLDEAVSAGGRLVKAAEKAFWGGTSGYFADPEGHLWEVAHNPYAPLGTDGRFQWNGTE